MTEISNPYQPPASDLKKDIEESDDLYFFTASPLKLVLMSLCTFGLYEFYWFYLNWHLIKGRTGQSIMPFWRAFFALLWAYSFFRHLKQAAIKHDIPSALSIGWLAFAYFIIQILWRLPDPFWLISSCSVVALLPANALALTINKHIAKDSHIVDNSTFTIWNWLGLIVGGALWVLVFIGLFFSE